MPRKDERPTRTTAAAAGRQRKSAGADPSTALQKLRSDEDVAFVEALAKLLKEHDLTEIEVTREYGEDDELKVRLARGGVLLDPTPTLTAPRPAAPQALSAPPPTPAAPETTDPADHPGAVPSPMVGTVYLAAEPGAPNFVSVGDRVEEGQTLLIIEAMKTMNQIPSPRSGVLKSILVVNEQPIEFGAALVVIE